MISVTKPWVWLVVLCCLMPRAMSIAASISEDSNDCEIATTSVSVTCGLATFFVALGSISACIGTVGAACGTLAAIGAVAGLCGAGVGHVDCGDEDSDTDKIIRLLGQIRSDIADVSSDVDLGFYDGKYEDDIEIIHNAAELYERFVISGMKNGALTDSYSTKRWIQMMGTGGDLANALIEVEDMIKGDEDKGQLVVHSSIYEMARKHDLCSPALYQYVLNLLFEGTTLYLIYLKTESKVDIPKQFMDELKDRFKTRVFENERLYDTYCRNNVAIESFRIKISDRSYANTGGSLRIGVQQGDNSCETDKEIFDEPERNEIMTNADKDKFGSCSNTWFQPRLNKQALEIRILSDSTNDAYIDKAAIKIGGVWREWVGHQVKINKHGDGNSWKTVLYPAAIWAICQNEFTFPGQWDVKFEESGSVTLKNLAGNRADAYGTVDVSQTPYTGTIHHPDMTVNADKKFWFYPDEGSFYFNGDKGKTTNIWKYARCSSDQIGSGTPSYFVTGSRTSGAVLRSFTYSLEENCKNFCIETAGCKAAVTSPASWGTARACYAIGDYTLFRDEGWATAEEKTFLFNASS